MAKRKTKKDVSMLRSLSHGRILSRSALKSNYLTRREGSIVPPGMKLTLFDKFRSSRVFAWFATWFDSAVSNIGPRHVFIDPRSLPSKGIYEMDAVTRIALAGDWGTGAYESEAVAIAMQHAAPDFTLHIGDVYYTGSKKEILQNCALKPGNNVVAWPRGSKGSFAMLGNHEMFNRGFAYFDTFLPNLGFAPNGIYPKEGQQSSLFCLENEHWLVVGLDTGYNSVQWGTSFGLTEENIGWLQECIFTAEKKNKGVILFSHHQYFSRFEGDYKKTAEQLAAINGFLGTREILWIWGHEHRFSGYEISSEMLLKVHGRCIGHSGMPIDIKPPDTTKTGVPPLAFYDNRKNPYYTEPTGMNGYCLLDFTGNTLTLTYYDGWWIPKNNDFENGAPSSRKILTEIFHAQNGEVKLMSREKHIPDPDFNVFP